MKNTIKNKLEIGNPEKYVDGYYQLSKKQKWLWVGGLFLIGLVFFSIRANTIGNVNKSSPEIIAVSLIISSIMLVAVSFIVTFICYYPSFYFFNKKKERKKIAKKTTITLYQLWTVFLVIIMSLIIFNINYTYKHIGLLFSIILFINFFNHKKL